MGLAAIFLVTLGHQALVARQDPERNALTRLLDWWATNTYGRIWGERASVTQVYFSLTCFLCAALVLLAFVRDLFRYVVSTN